MPINVGEQQKYKFTVVVTDSATPGVSHTVNATAVTEPDRRAGTVAKRIIGGVEHSLAGPLSYGELTIRFPLNVTNGVANTNAAFISYIEALHGNDADKCNVSVMLNNEINGVDQVSYRLDCVRCIVVSTKFDDVDAKADDDVVNFTVVLQPQSVERLSGVQLA